MPHKRFADFSVAVRIYVGFGVLLAVMAGISCMGILNLKSTQGIFSDYAVVSQDALRISTIDRLVVGLRRNALVVATTGDPKAIDRFHEIIGQITPELVKVRESVTLDEDRETVRRISELVEKYSNNFETLVNLYQKRQKIIDDVLGIIGPKLKQNLEYFVNINVESKDYQSAINGGKSLALLMQLRFDVLRFIDTSTEESVKQARQDNEVFASEMKQMASLEEEQNHKNLLNSIQQQIDNYMKGFLEVSSVTSQYRTLVDQQMANQAQEIGKLATSWGQRQRSVLSDDQHIFSSRIDNITLVMFIVAVTTGLFSIVLAIMTSAGIVKPVVAMTLVLERLAKGDHTLDIPNRDREDEIGRMAQAAELFKQNAFEMVRLSKEQEDFKQRSEEERRVALHKMADTFERSVGKVISTVTAAATQLQRASGEMADSAGNTSQQATYVANSAQQASANVQTVASATEELSSSIGEISRQMTRSREVALRANQQAGTTNALVIALSNSVSKIGDIVDLINDIASQTNLLALNATIESARAGDAGKGFAVVAGEVKHLAGQTARATEEIARQISAVQKQTTEAVEAISAVAQVLTEMAEISSSVAAAVQQQSMATNEIARNVEQAANGTESVSANISSVEESARHSGNAAHQIRLSALDLSRQAEYLNHEVSRFLNQVRSEQGDLTVLVWSDDLATGIAPIDRDHQMIIEEINQFYTKMMHGEGHEGAARMSSQMSDHIIKHFQEEQRAMGRVDYSGLEQHRRIHDEFLQQFNESKDILQSDQPDAIIKFFDTVSGWLAEHIRTEDRNFALFMQSKRAV